MSSVEALGWDDGPLRVGVFVGREALPREVTLELTTTPCLTHLRTAYQQRTHSWGEERVRVPLAGLHERAEALQGPVHAGCPHAQAHG